MSEFKYAVIHLALALLMVGGALCSVQKSKKCVLAEWINFKDEQASLISRTEDVDNFSKCLRMCSLSSDCKTLNYNETDGMCELREEMTEGMRTTAL